MDEVKNTAGRAGSTILVTGSNGQLGKELQQIASLNPSFSFVFSTKEDLPVDDTGAIRSFFDTHQPQYLINCAAYTAVDKAETEKESAFRINADAVGIMAGICKEYHAKFIHLSTDYVFDGMASVPYKEDAAINPQTVYGQSKAAGEQQALKFNPAALIIRTAWVYSAYGKNFVKTILKLLQEKKEINVVNDQFGSPTWGADLAELIMQIIPSGQWEPGIYHYSNEGILSWFDFAEQIKKITGAACTIHPIPTASYPTPAKRPAYSALDKTKIQQIYGIRLKDWKESLSQCVQRLKNNAAS